MNPLRSRKEENDKLLNKIIERKWFQKMRSSSSTSLNSYQDVNDIPSLQVPKSEQRRGSTPDLKPEQQESYKNPRPRSSYAQIGSKLALKGSRTSDHSHGRWGSASQLEKDNRRLSGESRCVSPKLTLNTSGVVLNSPSGSPMFFNQGSPQKHSLHTENSKEELASNQLPQNTSSFDTQTPRSSPNANINSPFRLRANSHASWKSKSPSKSQKSGKSNKSSMEEVKISSGEDDLLHRKLGKLFFWEKPTSDSSSVSGNSHSRSSVTSIPPSEFPGIIPFPESASMDVPRVVVEFADKPRRRRVTPESQNRSRSSSVAPNFGRNASNSTSFASSLTHRPTPRRSTSSDDVRLLKNLPLPPPPTIGLEAVLDDPHVKGLNLDPMAVRYADHMHMLGYTRNRYICALLAKESSKEGVKYNAMVMQAFIMRMLRFQGEPLDMSLRKFLFRMALAQEGQQIERMLDSFSILWHYQNPDIFSDAEQVLYVVFSMVMLHTDVFNKNIKHKISKADYIRNAAIDGMAPEIFEYFYDNITAATFRADDDLTLASNSPVPSLHGSIHNLHTGGQSSTQILSGSQSHLYGIYGEQHSSFVPTSLGLPSEITDTTNIGMECLPLHNMHTHEDSFSLSSRRSSSFTWIRDQSTDPYPFLLENRLDALRPELSSISKNPPFVACEMQGAEELLRIRQEMANTSVRLLLVSQRSRPDAYILGQDEEVLEAQSRPGIIEVPVIKHGVVLRREAKRMVIGSHKPTWREWGFVLTHSRLYIVKNASWVRQLGEVAKASVDMLQNASSLATRDMAALVRSENKPVSGNSEGRHGSNQSQGNMHSSSTPNLADDSKIHHFVLVEGGRDSSHQSFAVHSEEEVISWVQTINVVATQTSLNVSLEPPSTNDQLEAAISEVDEQMEAIRCDIAAYQKTLRHFKLLAPLHQRTREVLVFTAGRYSSKCDDALAEIARLQAYRNALEVAQM